MAGRQLHEVHSSRVRANGRVFGHLILRFRARYTARTEYSSTGARVANTPGPRHQPLQDGGVRTMPERTSRPRTLLGSTLSDPNWARRRDIALAIIGWLVILAFAGWLPP